MCVCVCERERERETDRQTERERQRQTDRQTETDRDRGMQTERRTDSPCSTLLLISFFNLLRNSNPKSCVYRERINIIDSWLLVVFLFLFLLFLGFLFVCLFVCLLLLLLLYSLDKPWTLPKYNNHNKNGCFHRLISQ